MSESKPVVYSMDEYKTLRYFLDVLINKYEKYKDGTMIDDEFKFLCLTSKDFQDGIFGEDKYIVDMYLRTALSFPKTFDVNFDHKYAINHIILDFLNEHKMEIFKKIIDYLYVCCDTYKSNFETEYRDILERQKFIDRRYKEVVDEK